LAALRAKWLPQSDTDDDLGLALFIEKEHWQNMEIAIANGIAKALNG
jgi:hypothetical protein